MSAIYLSGGTLYLPPPLLSFPGYEGEKKKRFSVKRDGYKVIRELRDWLRELFQKKKRNLRY